MNVMMASEARHLESHSMYAPLLPGTVSTLALEMRIRLWDLHLRCSLHMLPTNRPLAKDK